MKKATDWMSTLTSVRGRSEKGRGTPPADKIPPPLLTLDGMLFSGTMNNFLGSEPILLRTLGSQPVLKTDNFLRWLQRKDPSPTSTGPAPSPSPGETCHSELLLIHSTLSG